MFALVCLVRSRELVNRLALIATCALLVAGCSTPKIWPFYKKPKPAPEIVHELDLVNPDGTPATYPQTWKRNTLLIDLSGVSGTGSVAARLPEQSTWPVRVAVRVRPGSVEQVEIQGEERNVLPVAREGVAPIDLEFAPSVYRKTTSTIYINWGFMPQFAVAVLESEPGFVSPTEVPDKPATPPAPTAPLPESAPVPGTAAEPEGASDILKPSDAAPPQPSPPPGT
jgi:hypothetical protein